MPGGYTSLPVVWTVALCSVPLVTLCVCHRSPVNVSTFVRVPLVTLERSRIPRDKEAAIELMTDERICSVYYQRSDPLDTTRVQVIKSAISQTYTH